LRCRLRGTRTRNVFANTAGYAQVVEQYNFIVPRRENASPLAILGIAMQKRERAVA
jgi:hypothetical protein